MIGFGSLISLIFIVALIMLVVLSVKSIRASQKKWMHGNMLKYIFLIYFGVLLISAVVFPFIPFQSVEERVYNGDADRVIARIHDDFYENIFDNKKPNLNQMDLRETYEWDFDHDTLHLSSRDTDFYGTVIVEKIEDLQEKIKAESYVMPSVIDNIFITEDLPAFHLQWDDGVISISHLGGREINEIIMSQFQKEFTISQFTDDPTIFRTDSYSVLGEPFLYLQVPENVNIKTNTENIFVHYVN